MSEAPHASRSDSLNDPSISRSCPPADRRTWAVETFTTSASSSHLKIWPSHAQSGQSRRDSRRPTHRPRRPSPVLRAQVWAAQLRLEMPSLRKLLAVGQRWAPMSGTSAVFEMAKGVKFHWSKGDERYSPTFRRVRRWSQIPRISPLVVLRRSARVKCTACPTLTQITPLNPSRSNPTPWK
jgi:hypothetical protein